MNEHFRFLNRLLSIGMNFLPKSKKEEKNSVALLWNRLHLRSMFMCEQFSRPLCRCFYFIGNPVDCRNFIFEHKKFTFSQLNSVYVFFSFFGFLLFLNVRTDRKFPRSQLCGILVSCFQAINNIRRVCFVRSHFSSFFLLCFLFGLWSLHLAQYFLFFSDGQINRK